MKNIFDILESLMQLLMERRLFSWLPGTSATEDLVKKLLDAYPDNSNDLVTDSLVDIMIRVAPENYGLWFTNQAKLVDLGNLILEETGQKTTPGHCPPIYHIFADPALKGDEIFVTAVRSDSEQSETTTLEASPMMSKENDQYDKLPYLIDPDDHLIAITKTLTNLGRRVDNDIILEDNRVSRQHAQIRYTPAGCILFDLNSTGGTFINDKRISQQKLCPGDVISLAGVTFIFGDETNPDPSQQMTPPDHTSTKPPEDQNDLPMEFIG